MRRSWVRRLPITPMYPASERRAGSSAGTSNFGSCSNSTMYEWGPSPAVSTASLGQPTMTSSAVGNRSRVANAARGSTTVTRKPASLAIRASGGAANAAPSRNR